MAVRAVVFDIGETLLDDTWESGAWADKRQPILNALFSATCEDDGCPARTVEAGTRRSTCAG
jgi:hypothetical protein